MTNGNWNRIQGAFPPHYHPWQHVIAMVVLEEREGGERTGQRERGETGGEREMR